jgi:HSP20 family protein
VVRVELPGIDPDKDVELTVSEGALHVRAERRQEKTVEDMEEYRSELRYGAFSRVLPLPVGTSEKDITATYTAGILEIRVPSDQKKTEVIRIPITTK